MTEFEIQITKVRDLIKFNDNDIAIKRIIDFTLDTENINFYKKCCGILNWLDTNPPEEDKTEKLNHLLTDLDIFLRTKPIKTRQKILTGKNIKKVYGYNSFALGPVNIDVSEGDIVGLVGENGNGKTTLLRLLCGELIPTSGQIQYNIDHDDLYDLRTKLVYIPQRTDTWRGPMFENLVFTAANYGYPPEENNLIVELITARLGLRAFRHHSWKNLSSGYKMRFELARMLLRKPKILLIDEPLANLDILAQQTILEDFRAIAKSLFRPVGIILSSQQLYEVEKTSDQVIFLKKGVQRNLHELIEGNPGEQPVGKPLVIEFESSFTQSELNSIFSENGLLKLQYNGGTYIATFNQEITVNIFLETIVRYNIQIIYFRNISNSTRRFFVS